MIKDHEQGDLIGRLSRCGWSTARTELGLSTPSHPCATPGDQPAALLGAVTRQHQVGTEQKTSAEMSSSLPFTVDPPERRLEAKYAEAMHSRQPDRHLIGHHRGIAAGEMEPHVLRSLQCSVQAGAGQEQ